MAGPTVTGRLEVEFVPQSGTYVDISSRVREVTIDRPRVLPLRGIDAAPTVLTAVIRNFPDPTTGICPLTPGSPTGTYYPNIQRDRRVRFTAIVAGVTTYVRFLGWSDTWTPDSSDGDPNNSTVTLTASCVLSRYARRNVLSHYGEAVTVGAGVGVDYYPFDEPVDTASVRGIGSGGVVISSGQIIQPNRQPGSAVLSAPDGGHLMDGQIEFSRGDDNSPAPVVLIPLRAGSLMRAFEGSYKLSNDPKGSTGDDIISAYDSSGARLWSWSVAVISTRVSWQLTDDTGFIHSFINTGAPRDDAWHFWHIQFTATASTLISREKGGLGVVGGSFAWTSDPRPVAYLVVGGQMVPGRIGKQINTFQGGVSSLMIQYTTNGGFNFSEFCVPGVTTTAGRALSFINTTNLPYDTLVGGAVGTLGVGTDDTPVLYPNDTTNQLDRWNEMVRTSGGLLFTQPDGRRNYKRASEARSTTVVLTLDANADLDMPSGGWSATVDERPTRVTGVSPVGSVVVIDSVTETLTGTRLEGPSVQTAGGTLSPARSAAAGMMISTSDRLQFGVDATVTSTDKTVALMGVLPGDRVRVQNLPTAYLGVSYRDVYASGWRETYVANSGLCQFAFDTDPADDPPEGRFDDAEYGRFGMDATGTTITGGTCVGNTGTGTVIITTTSPLATTGGNFVLDLDWNGERITVSGVGGGTSPQTGTVTVRGVAPSVARVHAAGEIVNLYHQLTFGF